MSQLINSTAPANSNMSESSLTRERCERFETNLNHEDAHVKLRWLRNALIGLYAKTFCNSDQLVTSPFQCGDRVRYNLLCSAIYYILLVPSSGGVPYTYRMFRGSKQGRWRDVEQQARRSICCSAVRWHRPNRES